jgi:hypothetical protein
MAIELIPPVKDKAIFVLYIVQQPSGIVTASADYMGKSDEVLDIGMEALAHLNALSHLSEHNLYVSNRLNSLDIQ